MPRTTRFNAIALTALNEEAQAVRDEVRADGGEVKPWEGIPDMGNVRELRLEAPRCRALLATAPRMGNVYAAVTTTRIVESLRRNEIHARSFVLLGITGANPAHGTAPRLGDVILGDQLFEHDYGQKLDPSIEGTDGTKRQGYSLPIHAAREVHSYIVEEDLKTWLRRSVPKGVGERGRSRQQVGRVIVGAVASGDYVIKSTAKREELVKAYPQTVAIEMEAVGVAHALSQIPAIRFIFIKGVVDFCDGKKTDAWHAVAARNAAAMFVYLLRRGAL